MTLRSMMEALNPDERHLINEVLRDDSVMEELTALFPSSLEALTPVVQRIVLLSEEERAALLGDWTHAGFDDLSVTSFAIPAHVRESGEFHAFFETVGAALFAEVLKSRTARERARHCQEMGEHTLELIRAYLRKPSELTEVDRSRIKKVYVRLIDEGGQPEEWLERAGVYFVVCALAPRWGHLIPIWIDHLPKGLAGFARDDYSAWIQSTRWDWGGILLPTIAHLASRPVAD